MAEINKPSNVNKIWAETGISVKPADSKISQGWVPEIPPYEWMNWELNRQSAFASHINQHGLPVWDNETPYLEGKSYVIASDGNVYKSLSNNTNKDPISNSSDWVRAFDSAGDSYTKTETDNKYLAKANNLSDIPNAATARTNLSVYSKAEVDQSKAALAGSTGQTFSVANGTASTHAVNKSQLDVLSTLISTLQSQIVPSGAVQAFARNSAPTGWLVCDGSTKNIADYQTLYNAIGTLFGGNGTTTFVLPDLRGEFVRGWDNSRGVDSGRVLGSWQDSDNKAHTHIVNARDGSDNSGGTGYIIQSSGVDSTGNALNSSAAWALSDGGVESRPRNIALLYCIKV